MGIIYPWKGLLAVQLYDHLLLGIQMDQALMFGCYDVTCKHIYK